MQSNRSGLNGMFEPNQKRMGGEVTDNDIRKYKPFRKFRGLSNYHLTAARDQCVFVIKITLGSYETITFFLIERTITIDHDEFDHRYAGDSPFVTRDNRCG